MSTHYVLGHFGGHNTGDEAMLGGYLSQVPETETIRIKYKNGVLVNWGQQVQLFHGSYIDFIRDIGPNDTLVLCGGTHFHDDYSPLRLLRHWLYLARINFLFAEAKQKGARTLCIGNGFGPIAHPITKWLTKQFAGLCNVITVRDARSALALKTVGHKADLVHPDLAMLLYCSKQLVVKENIIGVSLTSLQSQRTDTIADEKLVEAVAEQLIAFARGKTAGLLIRLFVIRSGNRESDAPIMHLLHERLQQAGVRSEIYTFANDLNALIQQMLPCRIFLASRFHSAVLGAVAQNRLVILSYHTKLLSFAEEVSLPERYVVDLQRADALSNLAKLPDVLAELYATDQLNYTFPEINIQQLSEQLGAIHEEGLNFRVHANLRRSTQSGTPAI